MTVVGAGEGLGLFELGNGIRTYGVRFGKSTIRLDKQAYQVWQIAKLAVYNRSDFANLLELPENIVERELGALMAQSLVVEWPALPSIAFLTMYTVVPKGTIVKYENDQWFFQEIVNDAAVDLDLLPTTLWRLANPLFHLQSLFADVVDVSGMDNNQVTEVCMKWIPFLISRGLFTLDKWQ